MRAQPPKSRPKGYSNAGRRLDGAITGQSQWDVQLKYLERSWYGRRRGGLCQEGGVCVYVHMSMKCYDVLRFKGQYYRGST